MMVNGHWYWDYWDNYLLFSIIFYYCGLSINELHNKLLKFVTLSPNNTDKKIYTIFIKKPPPKIMLNAGNRKTFYNVIKKPI